MTQERKNEIYDKMLSWVFEHVKSDKELIRTIKYELIPLIEELFKKDKELKNKIVKELCDIININKLR